jgi:glycosyltransferase involved in cell wall biosynthesis
MNIVFIDNSSRNYQIESVYSAPLGGTPSAICYLSELLVKWGHEVSLFNNSTVRCVSLGVLCRPLQELNPAEIQDADFIVEVNTANIGIRLKPYLNPRTRLVFWTGHGHDQPAIQSLRYSAVRSAYDGFVMVSQWQRNNYLEHFGIPLSQSTILRNGIAPDFSNLFNSDELILDRKSKPMTLAYTSSPDRGLDILLEAFPKIRKIVSGIKLKVFSSMQIYYDIEESEDECSWIYKELRKTEGVEYIGAIPQPDLAQEMARVSVLSYPNAAPETFCISVAEAMASGCRVVTSKLGALPETTAGFASLVPIMPSRESYMENFINETINVLEEFNGQRLEDTEKHLRKQVDYITTLCSWPIIAEEWVEWLSLLLRNS